MLQTQQSMTAEEGEECVVHVALGTDAELQRVAMKLFHAAIV
jgi:hypothetical protein